MRIQITGKSFTITDTLKSHIEEKVKSITTYFDNVIDVHITLYKEKYRYQTEINLHCKGNDFIVNNSEKDIYYSVDNAVDKLEKQLKRYKGKVYKKTGKPKEEIFEEIEARADNREQEINQPRIFHMEDQIYAKPMTVDEAVIHLGSEGENVVVFHNSLNGNIGIVFRRQDGNIGFIEPPR